MNTDLIHIDSLAQICGFFETETGVNNHYGCKHSNCSESEFMQKIKGDYEYVKTYREDCFIAKKMTKRNIRCNRRLAKKFIKKARLIQFDNEQLKKYGLIQARKCYSFSCPLAYSADEIDFQEHGEENFEYDYLVIDIDLLKQLKA